MKNHLIKIVSIFLFISFFITPSFAVLKDPQEFKNKELPENYTAILIQLPGVINQSLVWNEKFLNPGKDLAHSDEKLKKLIKKSVDEIALEFNGKTFFNNPDYSYAYIKVPEDEYENLKETLKLLGFDVRNVSWGRALLDGSRAEIGLPYRNPQTHSDVGGNGVEIAILDTGIDCNHQDFNDCNSDGLGKLHLWTDVLTGANCCVDNDGHGTHVASIAAGTGAASNGLFMGIAPNASLLIFRISNQGGATIGDIAQAINGAVNAGADVISISFGWMNEELLSDYNTTISNACRGIGTNDIVNIYNAIQNAVNQRIPVVFAAGNEGPGANTIAFPACIKEVIAIGMTLKRDYASNEFLKETNSGSDVSRALIHVEADTSTESLDKEWYAFNTTTGDLLPERWRYITWSGITKVFNTVNPTINLRMEGQYKSKECFSGIPENWNPGSASKEDKFWTWTSSAAPYGGMEVFGKVHTTWGWCFAQLDKFGTTYVNEYECSGTPLSCNTYWSKSSCEKEPGCSWCGCGYTTNGIVTRCLPDKPYGECSGCEDTYPPHCYVWVGCDGEVTPCSERVQESTCGTPSTTGCSGYWVLDDTIVRFFNTEKVSLKGLPAPSSSRGPSPNGYIKPDVTAPGYDVCAALAAGTNFGTQDCGNANYARASGTSMAAPVVAGFIALLKELNPNAGYNDILNALINNSDVLINYIGEDSRHHRGYGRINITKAACSIKPSFNTGDAGDDPLTGGGCYDYVFSSGTCVATQLDEYCVGNNVFEYYASGPFCKSYSKSCEIYENPLTTYCNAGIIYKVEWGCSGSPGYCSDAAAPDSTYQYCSKTCSDTDYGINRAIQGSTIDRNVCSAGMTSCPYILKTDYCLNPTILREYFCSGNVYNYSDITCTGVEDSDGGQAFTTKGNCYTYNGTCLTGKCYSPSYEDYCLSTTMLREYYVFGSACSYVDKNCSEVGTNYACLAGYCRYPSTGGGGGGGGGRVYRK